MSRRVTFSFVVVLLLSLASFPRATRAQDGTPASGADVIEGRFNIGGRSLYLKCEGSGSPTVVLDGLPFGSSDWAQVAAGVAPFARVCIYDAAGVGLSDPPSSEVLTLRGYGEDLWALLAASGVEPPYVLVGAVLGADAVEYYQRLDPTKVAGLVLVSPRGLDPNGYLGVGALVPESERAGYEAYHRGDNPWRIDLISAGDELSAMPLSPIVPGVIIQGDRPEDGMPQAYEDVYRAAREATANRLGARFVTVQGKGNWIWIEQPEIVVDWVSSVVDAVHDPNGWQATPAAAA